MVSWSTEEVGYSAQGNGLTLICNGIVYSQRESDAEKATELVLVGYRPSLFFPLVKTETSLSLQ